MSGARLQEVYLKRILDRIDELDKHLGDTILAGARDAREAAAGLIPVVAKIARDARDGVKGHCTECGARLIRAREPFPGGLCWPCWSRGHAR